MEKQEIKNKRERIIISDLKEINENEVYLYPELKPKKDYDDFKGSEEEKKKLEEEEKKKIIDKKNQLKKESLDLHYNIDEQKKKELESTFGQIKLKIELPGKPQILREGKIISLSRESFTIYDSNLFKKIYEIKNERAIQPDFAIELDNGDLIIAIKSDDKIYNYELLVYRLKDKEYFLCQRIKEGGLGFTAKYYITGHCSYSRQYHKLDYKISELKKISGNRFFCLSNHGIKMYSLNEKNEYSLVLIEDELKDLVMLHEVNENKFIFSDQIVRTNYFYSSAEMYIGIFELKNATKEELDKKLSIVKEKGFQTGKKGGYCHKYNMFGFPIFRGPEAEEIEETNNLSYDAELKKIIESLKLSCSIKATQKYNNNSGLQLSDSIILKNKYLIMVIGVNILVIDLNEGTELKIFELLIDGIFDGNDSLFMFEHIDIKKWSNAEDNQFIFIIGKNVILVELVEDENGIKLKILNYSYFPNIISSKNLRNLSEKNNKFCYLGEESRSLFYENSNSNCISLY